MTELQWDLVGEREFETGVDHGVLYPISDIGEYDLGVPWNGLVSVTESPSGAEASPQYADNIKYLNLVSAEEFAATIEAFTYPDEWEQCDGSASPVPGVSIGQQTRRVFGFSYRTKVGNDINPDAGYKLHLVYGGLAAPSEKGYTTVNDSPEPVTFSWEVSTTPVAVPSLKPTASITIKSTDVDPDDLAALEAILYGTPGTDARLPLPEEVLAIFAGGALTPATATMPAYNSGTHTITIPTITGIQYLVDGEVQAPGALVITEDTLVTARAAAGYVLSNSDDDWFYDYV